MYHSILPALALSLFAVALLDSSSRAEIITLGASKDNTLYEDASGALSNGAGPNLFAGVTGESRITRGLISFDIAAEVPADATITGATLTLNASRVADSFPDTVSLHRVLTDWGEADSIADFAVGGGGAGGLADSGDATWLHSFSPGTNWSNVGGDFINTGSASTNVGGTGSYSWTSAQLVADVQDMLFDPQFNFGWTLLGNEVFSRTAKRFDSRENPSEANRPVLTIEYEVPGGGVDPDFDGDDDVDGDDLATWAGDYGSGSNGDADGDADSDGTDYLLWQSSVTGLVSPQTSTVPEPSSAAITLLCLSQLALNRQSRHSSHKNAQK